MNIAIIGAGNVGGALAESVDGTSASEQLQMKAPTPDPRAA
jgi:pyrroline-5-carboxylate reductase